MTSPAHPGNAPKPLPDWLKERIPEPPVVPRVATSNEAQRREPVSRNLAQTALKPTNLEGHLESLNLTGEATILTPQWYRWNAQLNKGEEPEKYRTLSFEEIAAQHQGWKLHLNFDPEDASKVSTISAFLDMLKGHDAISTYKIGKGGGKAFDQPGKEATVYVGHRDKSKVVAAIIEEALAGVLDSPEETTLRDDIEFAPHVMGRFDIGRVDPQFQQYGAKGLPFLIDDHPTTLYRDWSPAQVTAARQQWYQHADQVLTARYGAFYTGATV
jgi:hypothetical protein